MYVRVPDLLRCPVRPNLVVHAPRSRHSGATREYQHRWSSSQVIFTASRTGSYAGWEFLPTEAFRFRRQGHRGEDLFADVNSAQDYTPTVSWLAGDLAFGLERSGPS